MADDGAADVAPDLKGVVSEATRLPQKRFYRQRAHSNPLSDHAFNDPVKPDDADWSSVYPLLAQPDHAHKQVEFVDIGCGYGGMLIELSPMFPTTLILGIEIRIKVADYVSDRIKALRHNHPGQYQNLGVLRTNAMKFLPNYFRKGQVEPGSLAHGSIVVPNCLLTHSLPKCSFCILTHISRRKSTNGAL
eukprot:TRINITY_DN12055_c0_g1_i12.p3 TRINITY_DN12055_c0_g1~~TRINITY_DN12055_c0_g1_i12.p3  ORF type:complete len:190 (+),score=16.12 TRINITY_DN12055_c0_g1_i12:3992-4561(+)